MLYIDFNGNKDVIMECFHLLKILSLLVTIRDTWMAENLHP